jgi:hypothetical protein
VLRIMLAMIVVGCNSTNDPGPGSVTLSGGELNDGWAFRTDLGWAVHMEAVSAASDPVYCSQAGGFSDGFSFTKAALAATGDVPIVATAQVATEASATLQLGVVFDAVSGTVTLSHVNSYIDGTFVAKASDGTQLSGTLAKIPYCP